MGSFDVTIRINDVGSVFDISNKIGAMGSFSALKSIVDLKPLDAESREQLVRARELLS